MRGKLIVEVVWADITKAKGDIHFVGHYVGVPPQSAELVLDRALSGFVEGSGRRLLITEWTKRGLLHGALGEVLFFPWDPDGIVGVAGMGFPGTFQRPQLKILARSMARSVGLLPHRKTIATVLIGSGRGNLPVQDAAQSLVEGISEALSADPSLEIDKLRIVEQYLDRAIEVLDALKPLSQKDSLHLDIQPQLDTNEGGGEISPEFGCSLLLAGLAESSDSGAASVLDDLLAKLPDKELVTDKVRAKLNRMRKDCNIPEQTERLRRLAMNLRLREDDKQQQQADIPSRVAFWVDGQDIHAAAITNTVTVSEREFAGRMPLVQRAVERLMDPPEDEFKELTEALYRMLVHPDIKDIFGRKDLLVVEVDEKMARVQWEMLPTELDGRPLGVACAIARQLRTPYSPSLDVTSSGQTLRALVIGDPGDPNLGHSLPDAQQEALEVYKLLESCNVKTDFLIGAPEDGTNAGPFSNINIPPADYFEVVRLLLGKNYDIVHYCGHAQFDPEAPEHAGWVFKGGLLTARELAGIERPPSLVVANACLTAQLAQSSKTPASDRPTSQFRQYDAGLVASLAQEFFRQGVSDYIGTAWEVLSGPAMTFARSFYKQLQTGMSIGEAVRQAREELYVHRNVHPKGTQSAWGAYQHYGDPTRSLDFGATKNTVPG